MVILVNRLGLALGTQYILTIPGRKSGKLHSTPISLLAVEGKQYIVTGYDTEWVKNARASGWGYLTRGRKRQRMSLVELPVEERAPVLRQFPVQVPHGPPFFERILGLPLRKVGETQQNPPIHQVEWRQLREEKLISTLSSDSKRSVYQAILPKGGIPRHLLRYSLGKGMFVVEPSPNIPSETRETVLHKLVEIYSPIVIEEREGKHAAKREATAVDAN